MSPEKIRELFELLSHEIGIDTSKVFRNASVAVLYEEALKHEEGSAITSTGALSTTSGAKTGRSPKDKRIVKEGPFDKDIWWGDINIPLDPHVFYINRERAVDYLKTRPRIFVFDGFVGWHPQHRMKIRVICARAYHALFMHNMLIRPTEEELENFGVPDFTVLNAGEFPANRYTEGMTSQTSIDISFKKREMVILGTQYAGEMKKGIFTVTHYLMPKIDILSLHSSANVGENSEDVSLFFGLSGTGKTTLSADPKRKLIGDDEHCWSSDGIFNIEGGCYAKCINLNVDEEPEIFAAVKFGAVLENVVYDPITRIVDYSDNSLTENTRCAYPIDFIPNSQIPCIAGHPKNLILLTCDAFGILPPIARLNLNQAQYHFISGYTAKIAGTEDGIKEPTATFSACFGEPFIVWHPCKYAEMLAERIDRHEANAWLLNTGWVGGSFGRGGNRIPIAYTRAILDAIHSGELIKANYEIMDIFNFQIPLKVSGVPEDILHPERAWVNKKAYKNELEKLAQLFIQNFEKYKSRAKENILLAGPVICK